MQPKPYIDEQTGERFYSVRQAVQIIPDLTEPTLRSWTKRGTTPTGIDLHVRRVAPDHAPQVLIPEATVLALKDNKDAIRRGKQGPRTGPYPASPDELIAVARRYYIDDRSIVDIAQEFKLDTRRVTAWLKRARETGFVKISIHDPANGPMPDFPSERQPKQMLLPLKLAF